MFVVCEVVYEVDCEVPVVLLVLVANEVLYAVDCEVPVLLLVLVDCVVV